MPLYICNSVPGAIPQSAKPQIAADVTDIHCKVTGAPRSFVHVFFFEDAPQQPLRERSAFLFGSIREGRTAEQKQELVEAIRASMSTHAGLSPDEIIVDTADVPAGWVMEGGARLPEPGHEEDWLEARSIGHPIAPNAREDTC